MTQVKSDIKNVDDKVAAQTVRIDGVYAQINPPLIGSESDLIGNEGGYAGVWTEQSARIEGDLAQSKLTEQLSAQMNENNAVFKRQLEANSSAITSTLKLTETLNTKSVRIVLLFKMSLKVWMVSMLSSLPSSM